MDGEDCTICGSTQFHDEDGRMICHNGHDQGRGLATAEDDADFGHQGTVVRKKVTKEKQKISKGTWFLDDHGVLHEGINNIWRQHANQV